MASMNGIFQPFFGVPRVDEFGHVLGWLVLAHVDRCLECVLERMSELVRNTLATH